MDRRLLLLACACLPALPLLAQDGAAQPRHKVSAAELHKALSGRFPVRFGLQGLLELRIDAPALLLLPARQQVGATLQAEASGGRPRELHRGEMDVAFALRYEPADQTLRAHDLRVLELRWPGLPLDTAQVLQALLPRLARDAVGEIVLKKLSARELALADTMGFEPGAITVVEDGLMVWFKPKDSR